MKYYIFVGILLLLSTKPASSQIPTELLSMLTDYMCYIPPHAFALLGAIDMNEITELQEVLTNQLAPTLEYGNYTDIDINALLQEIKQMAPTSYAGIMQWLLPYKTRFRYLSTNAKRFIANTKKRLMGLESKQDELTTDYSIVKENINNVLNSWKALPTPDQECVASFITTMYDPIMSSEFNQFTEDAANANSQDELQAVVMDFATVVMNHTCSNPF